MIVMLYCFKRSFHAFIALSVTLSVGVGRMFGSVCLSASLYPRHIPKTNDPKLGIGLGDDLGIS